MTYYLKGNRLKDFTILAWRCDDEGVKVLILVNGMKIWHRVI